MLVFCVLSETINCDKIIIGVGVIEQFLLGWEYSSHPNTELVWCSVSTTDSILGIVWYLIIF